MKLKGPEITVELDRSQIFKDDPGMGTPVLIVLSNGDTASWNCGTSEGETADGNQFTPEQINWLAQITRWQTDWGTKTNLGLFRTVQRLVLDGE